MTVQIFRDSIKIALRILSSFHLVGKSLFGNICLSLTKCPATAAIVLIKNTYFFPFTLDILVENRTLGQKTAPESVASICFQCQDVLSTVCTWKLRLLEGKHLLSASSTTEQTEWCSCQKQYSWKSQRSGG